MSIVASEIKAYRSTTVNDGSSNGGRLSSVEIVSGQIGGLFPNVSPAERASGITRYRKLFMKVANDDDITLQSPYVFQTKNTAGQDRVCFFPATQRDTQSSITGSERKYGCGVLKTTVSSGVTTCVATVEDGATILFANGDKVRISDQATLGASGNEDIVTLSATPSVSGNDVTLTFSGSALPHGFAAGAFISSIYQPSDVKPVVDNFSVSSTGGTYNNVSQPILGDSIGTVEQTWTGTFTSDTTYTVSGDTLGTVGFGSVSSDFSPINPSMLKPFFKIASAGFSGAFLTGDTFTFQSHPAAVPIWMRQVVPAAATVASGNVTDICLTGETT